MRVPFVDLKVQFESIKDEVMAGFQDVCNNTCFILGPHVGEFEQSFAEFCGTKYCIGVASGTDALDLACRAAGIGPGDEIILPAHTFVSTALGVSGAGATPVFVDVNSETYEIDVDKIEAAITEKTKAIMPVHLYGHPADMDAILAIADKHGLVVIEDAAQAHGARYKERRCGSMGLLGCFSFYPGKNLGAYGDGGAVVTNNEEMAEKLRALRNCGAPPTRKYDHIVVGRNSRLDTLQAVVLNAKLPRLEKWNEARARNAALYNEFLADVPGLQTPVTCPDCTHVFHLYIIQTDKRDELIDFLKTKEVFAGVHYPRAMHEHEAYAHLGYKHGDFPVAENLVKRIVSLPMFPELTEDQIRFATDGVREFAGDGNS